LADYLPKQPKKTNQNNQNKNYTNFSDSVNYYLKAKRMTQADLMKSSLLSYPNALS
jgi:hypothetical protein